MYNFHFLIKTVTKTALAVVFLIGCCVVVGAEDKTLWPFGTGGEYKAINDIDRIIAKDLRQKDITPAGICSDQVFIRRVYLDVIGTLPEPKDVRDFLKDARPDKRALLIDSLLQRKEFAEYWSLKWCDLLRVKAEFPINLWPNAVQAYHRWIHDAIASNMPYDKFAREMLTSSGSNFRVPQVNFYRAVQGQQPASIANAAALTFMGVRLDKLPKHKREGMESLFSRVGYKKTAEWKEEIVFMDHAHTDPFKAVMPDGVSVQVTQGTDPRMVFADWLITPKNPWFAKNIVNRTWAWLFGRGLIHEPDDIRPDNPAVHPEVLDYLEKELVRKKYDLKHICRLILNSATYQQSSVPKSDNTKAAVMFACYPVRQLDAEVLIDALCKITGTKETYSSPIPEPFTFVPEEHRSIDLADGSITSQFLEMFGRPSRDTGLESERKNNPTDAQRLHMLNSTHIQNKIAKSGKLRRLPKAERGKRQNLINMIYLNILSRFPTQAELEIVKKYYATEGLNPMDATNDLIWALINTKEFLYRH